MIDPERVEKIFFECLGKDTSGERIEVDGIIGNYGLRKDVLEKYKDEIYEMLLELPIEFQIRGGGGWSFLNMCNDKNGEQWTGFHQRMEQLLCLGIGIGKVQYLMQKSCGIYFPVNFHIY